MQQIRALSKTAGLSSKIRTRLGQSNGLSHCSAPPSVGGWVLKNLSKNSMQVLHANLSVLRDAEMAPRCYQNSRARCLLQGITRPNQGRRPGRDRGIQQFCSRAVLLSSRRVTRGKDERFEPDFINAARSE